MPAPNQGFLWAHDHIQTSPCPVAPCNLAESCCPVAPLAPCKREHAARMGALLRPPGRPRLAEGCQGNAPGGSHPSGVPCPLCAQRRLAAEAAPGVPAPFALQYAHALEIMQRYAGALAAAARLLSVTRWRLGSVLVPPLITLQEHKAATHWPGSGVPLKGRCPARAPLLQPQGWLALH